MDFYKASTPFEDYIDYRMHRKHRSAAVRDILNKVQMDNYAPRSSRYDYLYSNNSALANPSTGGSGLKRWNSMDDNLDGTGLFHVADDVTYRSAMLPDSTPLRPANGVRFASPAPVAPQPVQDSFGGDPNWTSRRYPYSKTMENLSNDLAAPPPPPLVVAPLPEPETARVHETTLNPPFALGVDYLDRRPLRYGSLEDLSSPGIGLSMPEYYTAPPSAMTPTVVSPAVGNFTYWPGHSQIRTRPYVHYETSIGPIHIRRPIKRDPSKPFQSRFLPRRSNHEQVDQKVFKRIHRFL